MMMSADLFAHPVSRIHLWTKEKITSQVKKPTIQQKTEMRLQPPVKKRARLEEISEKKKLNGIEGD